MELADPKAFFPANSAISRDIRCLIEGYLEVNDYQTARLLLQRLVDIHSDPELIYEFSYILYHIGEYNHAIEQLNEAFRRKKCRKSLILMILCYVRLRQSRNAFNIIENNQSLFINQVGIQTKEKDKKEVGFLLTMYGKFNYLFGDRRNTVGLLVSALKVDPFQFNAFNFIVEYDLLPLKEEIRLVNEIGFGSSQLCRYVKAVYSACLSKVSIGDSFTNGAIAHLKSEFSLLSNNSFTRMCQAEILYYDYRFDDSFNILTKLIEKNSHDVKIVKLYASICYETGKERQLFSLCHTLVDKYFVNNSHGDETRFSFVPGSSIVFYAIGTFYLLCNKYEESRKFFSKATHLDNSFFEAWIGFAHSFSLSGEYDQAIIAYKTASSLRPHSHYPLLYISMDYNALRQDHLAEQYLLKAYNISPTDPIVLNELGFLYFCQAKYEISGKFLVSAYNSVSDNSFSSYCSISALYCNLGRIHMKLRNYGECLKFFKLAYYKNVHSSKVISWLGIAYQLNNRVEKAMDCYRRALSINQKDVLCNKLLKICLKAHAQKSGK